jgi:hypothetical protein
VEVLSLKFNRNFWIEIALVLQQKSLCPEGISGIKWN